MSAGGPGGGRAALEALSRHPDLVDPLELVRNGVPFDVAFSLPPDERLVWVVVFGELAGRRWDWGTMAWRA